jgi:hypothetical protein
VLSRQTNWLRKANFLASGTRQTSDLDGNSTYLISYSYAS